MNTPTEVKINITPNGYKTTILAGKEIISERKFIRTEFGAKALKSGGFQDDLGEDGEELAEVVDDLDLSDVMIALEYLH